jgi:putative acetyltransferase
MKIDIRPETRADYAPVRAVYAAAFGREDEARLVERLRRRPGFVPELSLTARHYDRVVGHILFTPVEIVGAGARVPSLALAPVAVLPAFQRKGVGGKLVKVGLSKAKKLGFTSVVVLGHPYFYPRFGFAPADKWHLAAPFAAPDEAFMAQELAPGALTPVVGGTVRYPGEFEKGVP